MAEAPPPNANALLAQALELPEGRRDAFLQDLRAERPDVALEVEELLAASQATEAELFLERGPIDTAPRESTVDPPPVDTVDEEQTLSNQTRAYDYTHQPQPDEVGGVVADDYELRGMLGKGGMGVVYRAYQRSLNREVALKLIPSRLLNSDEQVARFYVEAEAAAGLDHRGIVPVYDIGHASGVHYYAMAVVEGDSLASFLKPEHRLPPKRAAEIMQHAARAVQHAHDRAVIHRDLKPANILLDKDGQPRIADFGLAKIAGGDELTMTGQVMGTPSYMAPEQAEGDSHRMSTHVDIYALGATLYALLAGRPPFTAPTLMATLRKVQSEPPPPLPKSVPLDLRIVCERCLAKKPEDRYESAGALADDLGRYAAGFPIAARPIGRTQRVVRWAQRNPAVAASLIGLFATLSVAAVVSSIFAVRANHALADAEANAQRLGEAIEKTFVFASEDVLAQEPGMQTARRTLLHSARQYYEQLLGSGHASGAEFARTSHLLGQVQASLGEWDAAEASLRRALTTWRQLADDQPRDVALVAAVADTHHELAKLATQRRASDADLQDQRRDALLRQWEAESEAAVEWRQRAADLEPNEPERKRLLANALMSRGIALTELAQSAAGDAAFEAAAEQLEAAQQLRQQLIQADSTDYRTKQDLALGLIAEADLREARRADTDAALQQALALRVQAATTLASLPPEALTRENRWRLSRCYQSCGESSYRLGELADASRYFQQMRGVLSKLLRQDPNVLRYRIGVASAEFNLGQVLLATGDPVGYQWVEQAQRTLADAIAIAPTQAEAREMLLSYTRSIALALAEEGLNAVAGLQVERAIELLEGVPLEAEDAATAERAMDAATAELRSLLEQLSEPEEPI